MPSGHKLVGRWKEAKEAEAATKVQNLWRSLKSKKKLVKLVGEQEQVEAAKKLQAFARRRRTRTRQSLLSRTAAENPAWRPMDEIRLMQHEKEIIEKRRQWHSTMSRGLTHAQLQMQAEDKYRNFLEGVQRSRYDVWLALMQREQTRQMIEALEGRSWDRPLPYGVCSAALLSDAQEKHRMRKQDMLQDQRASSHGAPSDAPAVESRAEELEADSLLQALESDLGFDFSIAGDKPL